MPTGPGKTLRLPWYGSPRRIDPGIIDPARASAATPLVLADIANAGLVKFSPDLHVIPELAVSIPTISTDGRTYTFTIRQDARFADGMQCTAADVVYSLTRALSPVEHSPLAAQYLGGIAGADAVIHGGASRVTGITVVHRLTLRIHLAAPDATFLEKLAFPIASVVSARGAGGLGPYEPVRTGRPGILAFVPRPHYFDEPERVKSIEVVAVRNAADGLEMYRHGQLDAAWVAPQKMTAYAHRSDYRSSTALDGYYAVSSPADGTRIASALNRDALITSVGPGLAGLQTLIPPTVPDYVSSAAPALAPTGTAASSLWVRVSQPRNRLTQALRRALIAQVGPSRRTGHTVWIVHSTFLLPDPNPWLGIIWDEAPNWYRAHVTEANGLTNDPVSRMSMYSDSETWALSTGRVVPLAVGNLAWLLKSSVGGMDVTPLGLMPTNNNWSLLGVQ